MSAAERSAARGRYLWRGDPCCGAYGRGKRQAHHIRHRRARPRVPVGQAARLYRLKPGAGLAHCQTRSGVRAMRTCCGGKRQSRSRQRVNLRRPFSVNSGKRLAASSPLQLAANWTAAARLRQLPPGHKFQFITLAGFLPSITRSLSSPAAIASAEWRPILNFSAPSLRRNHTATQPRGINERSGRDISIS